MAARGGQTRSRIIDAAYRVFYKDGFFRAGVDAIAEAAHVTKPAEGPVKPEQWQAMAQTLLEGRFKLALHREKKEKQVLALVVAKSGPKLQKSRGNEDTSLTPGDHGEMIFRKMSVRRRGMLSRHLRILCR